MRDIRLYDFEFNLLYIENAAVSVEWYLRYNDIGSFEAHISADEEKTELIMNNKYIVAVQEGRQAIITSKQLSGNEIVLYGRTANWILSKRIIPKFNTYRMDIGTNAEDIARWVVSSSFADVDGFVLGDKIGLDYEKHFWRNVYNPVSEVVKDCLDNASAGHRVVFDTVNKQWRFEIIIGEYNPLIVSVGSGNVYSVTYDEDLQDYCSEGWYESSEAEEESQSEEDSESAVWKSVSREDGLSGIYRWEGVLSGTTQSEAQSSLSAKKWRRDCNVGESTLRCGVDYNLGDTVRVQYEHGGYKVCGVNRIVGVRIWAESGGSGEVPILEGV